jgi:hypothetical protein
VPRDAKSTTEEIANARHVGFVGKVVNMTDAGSGIGWATALPFVRTLLSLISATRMVGRRWPRSKRSGGPGGFFRNEISNADSVSTGRWANPEEVAEPLLFLASPAASSPAFCFRSTEAGLRNSPLCLAQPRIFVRTISAAGAMRGEQA